MSGKKDVTKLVKCIKGWSISLNVIKQLWPILRNNYDFSFLLTRRLNQDSLEHFFSSIRYNGGNSKNPTPYHFCRIFKQISCNKLLQPVKNGNCEINVAELMETLCSNKSKITNTNTCESQIVKTNNSFVNSTSFFPRQNLILSTQMNCLEENGLQYVCGYLIKRFKTWHNCSFCIDLLTCSTAQREIEVFTNLKRFNDNCNLNNASKTFYTYIARMEKKLVTLFDNNCVKINLGYLLTNELVKLPKPTSCVHFPTLKVVHLFVRTRMHYLIKFRNASISTSSKKNILNQFSHK